MGNSVIWSRSAYAEWAGGERKMTGPGLVEFNEQGQVVAVHTYPSHPLTLTVEGPTAGTITITGKTGIEDDSPVITEKIQVHVAEVNVPEQPIDFSQEIIS